MIEGGIRMKWFLLGVVFLTCSYVGIWVDEDQKKRIQELEAFIRLFEYLKAEIDYQLTPLKDACKVIGMKEKHIAGEVLIDFSKRLEAKESIDIQLMWQNAVDTYKNKLHLNSNDYDNLLTFSSAIGYLDKNMQKRNLDWVIEKLEHERQLAKEKYERCSKLNKSLGVIIGAAFVIFLI